MSYPHAEFSVVCRIGLLIVPLLGRSVVPSPARAQQPVPAVSGSITLTQPLTSNTPGDLAQRIVIDPSARAFAPWAAVGFRWNWDAVAEGDAARPTGSLGLRFRRQSLRVALGVSLDAAYDRLGLDRSDDRLLSPLPPRSQPRWPPHMPELSDSIPGKWRGELPDPIELTPSDIFGNSQPTGFDDVAIQARYTMQPVTDVTASADWGAGPVAVGLEAGWRLAGPASRQLWYSATVAAPLMPMFALVVGVDRRRDRLLAPNPTRMTLGLQWRSVLLGRRSPAEPKRASSDSAVPAPPSPSLIGAGRLVMHRLPSGVRLSIVAAGASRVEVRSDLTGWTAAAMGRGVGGTWQLDLAAGPGVHRLAMRIDGGAWLPPPGVPTGSDGYGGAVGLFVVEP